MAASPSPRLLPFPPLLSPSSLLLPRGPAQRPSPPVPPLSVPHLPSCCPACRSRLCRLAVGVAPSGRIPLPRTTSRSRELPALLSFDGQRSLFHAPSSPRVPWCLRAPPSPFRFPPSPGSPSDAALAGLARSLSRARRLPLLSRLFSPGLSSLLPLPPFPLPSPAPSRLDPLRRPLVAQLPLSSITPSLPSPSLFSALLPTPLLFAPFVPALPPASPLAARSPPPLGLRSSPPSRLVPVSAELQRLTSGRHTACARFPALLHRSLSPRRPPHTPPLRSLSPSLSISAINFPSPPLDSFFSPRAGLRFERHCGSIPYPRPSPPLPTWRSRPG